MFDIQGTKRLFGIVGRRFDGKIKTVPNLYCVRKHLNSEHKEYKIFTEKSDKDYFAFVSSPHISDQQRNTLSTIKHWCHPFRKVRKHFSNTDYNYMLLPESDFLDPAYVEVSEGIPSYDFFYLTINGKPGIENKGLKEFVKSIPILCGEFKLRGLIIVYFPAKSPFKNFKVLSKDQNEVIKQYKEYITISAGWQDQPQLARSMSSCKFGFFPNIVDCSPRIIPECLIRNRPILVNEKIWGGWHYVDEQSGVFFNSDDINSLRPAVDKIITNSFEPYNFFMKNFGFVKSSEKLANFLRPSFNQLNDFSHIYFEPYADIMKERLKFG